MNSPINQTRKINIRIRNAEDESKLSKKIGLDLKMAKRVVLKTEYLDLFDQTVVNASVASKRKLSKKRFFDSSYPFWDGMPRFYQERVVPHGVFELETNLSCEKLSKILDQKITDKTKSVWFPKLDRGLGDYGWLSSTNVKHRYPIFVISKGRPQCITARALKRMGADFKIVVEPSEDLIYKEVWGDYVLVGDFDTTTNSSIPVRNWVDEYTDSPKYWIMDDNIEDFNCLTDNQKYVCRTYSIFAATEDFVERFSNVGQAGLNYYSFAKKTDCVPPYHINTRIYSCILMDKKINKEIIESDGQLWRGRYNEDTDLSLRILKKGYCTILMNAFLAGKVTTQRMKGGNTDSVYVDGDDRKKFAESLREQHPDVVTVSWKFNRWHHQVDYSGFTQKLKIKPNYKNQNYGLYLDKNGRNHNKVSGAVN